MPRVDRTGACPYCGSRDFSEEEPRTASQDLSKCDSCSGWSAIVSRNGFRYPLHDRADKESSPTVILP